MKTIEMMVAKFFCILISAFQVKGFCSTGKCEKISFDELQDAEHDKELVGHVFHNSVTLNPQQCYLWCINDCRCLSINYKVKNNTKYCELNEGNQFYKLELSEKHPEKRLLRTAEKVLHQGTKFLNVIEYFYNPSL